MRPFRAVAMTWVLLTTGCLGPPSLHQAVLGYDETVSRLDREILVLNIARMHQGLPPHFTVTSSIAATFDYRANAGFLANFIAGFGLDSYAFNVGVSAAENPTLSIVPIQGEDFTRRILTPLDESKFEFLIFQGAPIDMVLRLMADGIEVQARDGTFERFILNWPTRPEEYREFRRRALHLAWLNATRQLFVGTVSFEETLRTKLAGPPSPGEIRGALEKGYRWEPVSEDGAYILKRPVAGRVAVTNYDPRRLGEAERQALHDLAVANPANFVLVDVRPGYPGGDYPLFGGIKLRSLNMILAFIAAGIQRAPEIAVDQDPRTATAGRNPRRALAVELRDAAPPDGIPGAFYAGRHYAVADTPWDREAFTLLYQLFQMTVTDVSGVGVPVTISK